LALSLVTNEAVAQCLGILDHMMAESLCNHEPDAVRGKRQGAMLAEGNVHGID
jgi:hypothetical protein